MDREEGRRRVRIAVSGEMGRRGWNIAQLHEATGLDKSTLGDFLSGQRWGQHKTLGAIEKALGWPPGTIARILEGEDPPGPAENAVPVGAGVDPDLLADLASASPEAIDAVRAILKATKGK